MFSPGGSHLPDLLLDAGNRFQQILSPLLDSNGLEGVMLAQLPRHAIHYGLTRNQLPISDLRLSVS